MKKNRPLLIALTFSLSLFFSNTSSAQVEGGYLKDSLVDLKQSARDVVEDNRKLKEKIQRIEDRIPVLKDQYSRMDKDVEELMWQRKQAKELYRSISNENVQSQKRLFELQEQLNRYYKEHSSADDRFYQKERDIEQLKRKVSRLKREIKDLESKNQNIKPVEISVADDDVVSLRQSIQDWRGKIEEAENRFTNLKQKNENILKEFDEFQMVYTELNNNASMINDEIETANKAETSIHSRWDNLKADHARKFERVLQDVVELMKRKDRLRMLIDQSVKTHDQLTDDFNKDKADLYGTIEDLNDEHKQLKEQEERLEDSLEETRRLLGKIDDADQIDRKLAVSKKKLDEVIDFQLSLNDKIEARHDEIDSARKNHQSLTRDLKRLTRDVERSRKQTDNLVKQKKGEMEDLIYQSRGRISQIDRDFEKMVKANMEPKEILETMQMKKIQLETKFRELQTDIREIMQEPVQIQQEMEKKKREQERRSLVLDKKLERMREYELELAAMIEGVNRKMKSQILTDQEFSRSETSLKDHLDILRRENTFLNHEVQSLSIARDRVTGKRMVDSGGIKAMPVPEMPQNN